MGTNGKTPTLSAGVVVVRRVANAWHFLLLRAGHYWDFPKGMVDPGEDPLAAAIRETEEESMLINLDFHWGHAFTETEPYGKNKIARYYVAESKTGDVDLPVSAELGHPEHDEYRWLSYDEARLLVVPRVLAVLDWAGKVIKEA